MQELAAAEGNVREVSPGPVRLKRLDTYEDITPEGGLSVADIDNPTKTLSFDKALSTIDVDDGFGIGVLPGAGDA